MPFRYYVFLLALGLGAIPLACGVSESKEDDRIRAVVARGTEKTCRVLQTYSRTSSSSKGSSKTTRYYGVVEVDGAAREAQVDRDAYVAAEPDQVVPWYDDAPTGGFSKLEFGKRTDNHIGPYLIAFALIFVIRMVWRRALPRPGAAALSPVSSVEPEPGRLPPPPRDGPTPGTTPSFFPLAMSTAGISAALASYFADQGTWGAALLAAAQGLGALLAVLGASRKLRTREAALWRDGVEAVGLCSLEWSNRFRRKYEAEFSADGKAWRLVLIVDVEQPLRATQGKPASVLYDPRDPRKATIAPTL